jgi:hypothetical protein
VSADSPTKEERVKELLTVMVHSAKVHVDKDGIITGYQIKTGALHKLAGLLDITMPVNLPEIGWKSAVTNPPDVEYATYIVITREGDPSTRRRIVWGYQRAFDRPTAYCDYTRNWGHANGFSESVEFYHELPAFEGVK